MKNIAYVGIDYHLKTLTIAVMIEGQNQFHDIIKITAVQNRQKQHFESNNIK